MGYIEDDESVTSTSNTRVDETFGRDAHGFTLW
jgi:hypothetical protein